MPVSPDDLKQRAPDFLTQDLIDKVGKAPAKFTLAITVAEPGDPTADPSTPWPDARRTVDAGTLVLPAGMKVSDDPFPSARSAAYAVSYNRRTAEDKDYPRAGSTK